MKTETAQHTAGPWRWVQWGERISIDSPDYMGICHININGNSNAGIPFPQDRANAELIAAAPETAAHRDALLSLLEASDGLRMAEVQRVEGELERMRAVNAELYNALAAVYSDIELDNVKGGSAELSIIVDRALGMAEGRIAE